MLIVYLSLTGNIRTFVQEVGMKSLELNYTNPLVEVREDFILITPSYDEDVNEIVSSFIDYKDNYKYLKAFVGSGSLNFNEKYCFNAIDLSNKYKRPLIHKFEFSGTDNDKIKFKEEVKKFAIT